MASGDGMASTVSGTPIRRETRVVVISLMVGRPIGMSGACVVMGAEECREETNSLRLELPLYLVDELTSNAVVLLPAPWWCYFDNFSCMTVTISIPIMSSLVERHELEQPMRSLPCRIITDAFQSIPCCGTRLLKPRRLARSDG